MTGSRPEIVCIQIIIRDLHMYLYESLSERCLVLRLQKERHLNTSMFHFILLSVSLIKTRDRKKIDIRYHLLGVRVGWGVGGVEQTGRRFLERLRL